MEEQPIKKRKRNYINGPDLCDAIEKYQKEYKAAIEAGETPPQISKYIGECFFKIATNLAKKRNFSSYSYIDDMILDGVERCVKYINTFNPEKTRNAFAYFTRTIHNSFLNRIKIERKELYYKYKMMLDQVHCNMLYEGDTEGVYNKINLEYVEEYIRNYDELEEKRKERLRLKQEEEARAKELDGEE